MASYHKCVFSRSDFDFWLGAADLTCLDKVLPEFPKQKSKDLHDQEELAVFNTILLQEINYQQDDSKFTGKHLINTPQDLKKISVNQKLNLNIFRIF